MSSTESHFPTEFPGTDAVTEINPGQLAPTSRYRYIVLQDTAGNKYFSKKLAGIDAAADAKWSKCLENEATWAQFACDVGEAYPELRLTGLKPLYVGRREDDSVEQLVYPYVEAPLMAEPGDITRLHAQEVMSRYVDVLLALDAYGGSIGQKNGPDIFGDSTPFDRLDKRWDEWIEKGKLLDTGVLTEQMANDARTLIEDNRSYIHPRMQHGDFVPWHLFDDGSRWISFDGEHASHMKPRFYDVAYSFSRIFTRSKDSEAAQTMLAQFVEKGLASGQIDAELFANEFIPVLTTRAIGMFFDAQNDKSQVNYFSEAGDLFDRCMSRDLGRLTGVL